MLSPADIADSLAADRTKRKVERLANQVLREGLDIEAYIDEIHRRKLPLRWHMTWLLSHYIEENPDVGARDQQLIWKLLVECGNHSMERDLWRALSFVELDEEIAGDVFDAAIQLVPSQLQPIALRAHALYVARNIARAHEELRRELILVLEELPADESRAIRTRSKNTIREFSQRPTGATRRADR